MNNVFEICSISQQKTKQDYEAIYKIKIRDNEYDLTYNIEGDGINELPERCDPVVVTFLNYAIYYGMSFHSQLPISEKLYYHLKNHVIPQLSKANNITTTTDIVMPLTDEKYYGSWRGTGISLGVDSLTTIHEYSSCDMPDNYRLTHLVNMKTGAHHGMIGYYDGDIEKKLFRQENEKAKEYCEKFGFNLITIATNLYEICAKEFNWDFERVHGLHNLGTILILQNYFGKYYYATGGYNSVLRFNLQKDQINYEKWLLPLISTESINFYSGNKAMDRISKEKYISQFPDVTESLHVCWKSDKNCGECDKCIRTIIQLDYIGELDKYSKVFDLDKYYNNKEKYITYIAAKRLTDHGFQDIYLLLKERKEKMPNALAVWICRVKIFQKKMKRYGFSQALDKFRNKYFGGKSI